MTVFCNASKCAILYRRELDEFVSVERWSNVILRKLPISDSSEARTPFPTRFADLRDARFLQLRKSSYKSCPPPLPLPKKREIKSRRAKTRFHSGTMHPRETCSAEAFTVIIPEIFVVRFVRVILWSARGERAAALSAIRFCLPNDKSPEYTFVRPSSTVARFFFHLDTCFPRHSA